MKMLQIDDRLVAAAKNLPLLAKQLVTGYMQGIHRSPFHGSSQEFAAYRQYMPGDAIGNVDWKVWARTDHLFIREYQEETNYRAYLFLDSSKSMDFGDGATHKFTYAKILCATLALLMKNQNDAAGLVLLGQPSDRAEDFVAPSTRTDHLDHLLLHLQELKADGECEHLGEVLSRIEECRNRSISVIVTDGLFPLDEGRRLLDHLRLRNHDTIFFHLLAPQEMEPNFDDDMIMIDSETGRELTVDGVAMREPYAEKLASFLESIESMCIDAETDYYRIVTSEPLDESLRHYLELRESRLPTRCRY